ncbi:hypothetical protein NQ314_014426 [Rhamnusium bicolor]|uniref:Transmembrane protein 120 homolog n=1 Tax=Rhamnusium bicolor TaxID=1586634 RepID=A0AAV8X2F3_9CUCU|nr:hypothetical protein NQ314_014426 [Rhamnusium bicolor]
MSDPIWEEWQELSKDYNELETVNGSYLKKLAELTNLQQTCLKHIARQRNRLKMMKKIVKQLKREVNADKVAELKNYIMKREAELQVIEQTLPKQSRKYLKIVLGSIDVSFLNKEDKFKYKDEYEKFKLINHVIAFFLSILNLYYDFRPLQLFYVGFLVWYYCTISIRESILKVNGSRIKGWWTLHHVLSTVGSAIYLVWPENETWSQFKSQFLWYNIYNCLIQYLQFKYQRGALYRLKALGERDKMDITIEGFHSWMWKGLTFLLPFLFIGYFFQLSNAIVLYKLSYHPQATWHVMFSSALFFIFFVGNTITTIMVVPNKIREKMMFQYRVMTQRLYNVVNEKVAKINLQRK